VLAVNDPLRPSRNLRGSELERGMLLRCKAGDPLAFRTFVAHYERAVFALLSRIVRPGPEVEDLAQEAFLRAFRAFGSFDPDCEARPSAWILTIATRLALDAKKRRSLTIDLPASATELVPDTTTPEREHARRELGRAIARAGAELPRDQLAAFVLAEFHDLSSAEIAAALGVPENTAKTRLFRARQHMRERLASLRKEVADGSD
jgi:RNA polymerase sigma-70 factor (ECF subfamily)